MTAMAAPIATAASAALPPARRISTPISEASGFAAATIPVRAVRPGVRVMLLMPVLPPFQVDLVRYCVITQCLWYTAIRLLPQ